MAHTLTDLMSVTLDKLRTMADTDVVIGKPITTPDGTTVLPVSKVSFGVASGGTDFMGKNNKGDAPQFGGGGGAGLSVEPVAFLILSPTGVRLLPMSAPGGGAVDRLLDLAPGLIDKIEALIKGRGDGKDDPAE